MAVAAILFPPFSRISSSKPFRTGLCCLRDARDTLLVPLNIVKSSETSTSCIALELFVHLYVFAEFDMDSKFGVAARAHINVDTK